MTPRGPMMAFISLLIFPCLVVQSEFITFSYGGRSNKLFVPSSSGNGTRLPLYVMLHGCTQNPTDFATGTKMNKYGEEHGLLVLYPEQTSAANQNKCWNWFEASQQVTSGSEPTLIAGMTKAVMDKYNADPDRVYVAGLSAGAAMSVIMGATYPHVYSAICVGAGLEYAAATSVTSAFTAMSSGGPNPVTQGDAAYKQEGSRARLLGVLVVHGTSDYTVRYVNGQQVISQWARTDDLVLGSGKANGDLTDKASWTTKGTVPGQGGRTYTVNGYDEKRSGRNVMQFITVDSMGHAWSGGDVSGTYTDPKGPDASLMMIQFFAAFSSNSSITSSSSSETTTTTTTTTATTTTTTTTMTTTSTTSSGDVTRCEVIEAASGYVGQYAVDGSSTSDYQIGNKGMYNVDTFRLVLAFDLTNVPRGKKISRVELEMRQDFLAGSVSTIAADIISYQPQLSIGEYSASSSALNVVSVSVAQEMVVELPSTAYQYLTGDAVSFRFKATSAAVSFDPNLLTIVSTGAEKPALLVYHE